MAWQHMAHIGPLPPIWDLLLDLQSTAETLHLLSLVEFTDLYAGCSCAERLRDPVCGSLGPLPVKETHETIGEEANKRVRLREEVSAIDANAQTVV